MTFKRTQIYVKSKKYPPPPYKSTLRKSYQCLAKLTHISNFPGYSRSGILAAYMTAPAIYSRAMRNNQPKEALYIAFQKPSVMTKCNAGITPLIPNAMNIPINNSQFINVK